MKVQVSFEFLASYSNIFNMFRKLNLCSLKKYLILLPISYIT